MRISAEAGRDPTGKLVLKQHTKASAGIVNLIFYIFILEAGRDPREVGAKAAHNGLGRYSEFIK